MKFIRVRAIARKEFIQIRRDRLSLAMAFLMPVMLLFIYGYAVTFDVDRISTVVCDLDKSSLSRELIREFDKSGYFTVISYPEAIVTWMPGSITGGRKSPLPSPSIFSKRVRAGKDATIEVIIDGSNSNTASIAEGYIFAISEAFPRRLGGGSITPLIDSRSRVWYNTELRSRNFIIPGLIAIIMAVIVALLTSLTVAREWDRGTMEQLMSTPLKPVELVTASSSPTS